MALDAGTAYVTILPNVSATFTSALTSSLSGPIKNAGTQVSKALGSALTLNKAVAIGAFGAIGAAAAHALDAAIHATETWGEQVLSLKRTLGLSAEQASKMDFVLQHFGVTTQQASVGFGLLLKNAANNSAALAKWGVVVRDAQGHLLPFNALLANVSDRYRAASSSAEKAAIGSAAFGRSWRNLIPLLQAGSAQLAAIEAEAQRYGLVLTEGNLEAIHKFALAQRDLSLATQGFQVQIGEALIPVLTHLVQWLTAAVEVFNKVPGPVRAFILAAVALGATLTAAVVLLGVVAGAVANLGRVFTTTGAQAEVAAGQMQLFSASAAEAGAASAAAGGMGGVGGMVGILTKLGPVGVVAGIAIASLTVQHYALKAAADQAAKGHSFLANALTMVGALASPVTFIIGQLSHHSDEAAHAAVSLGTALKDATTPAQTAAVVQADLAAKTQQATDKFYAQASAAMADRDALLGLEGGLMGVWDAMVANQQAAKTLTAAEAKLAADRKKGANAKTIAADEAALAQARRDGVHAAFNLTQAEGQYADQLLGPVKTAVDAVKTAHDQLSAAQLQYGATSTQAQKAATALAAAQDNLHAAEAGVLPAQQKVIGQFNAMLRAEGYNKDQIAALDTKLLGLVGHMKGVPKTVSTQFNTPGLEAAIGGVEHLAHGIEAVQGPHDIIFRISTQGHAPVFVQAAGGVFRAAAGSLFLGPGNVGFFRAGEAAYPTPLGTGAELVSNRGVLPLDDGTIGKLGRAIAEAGGSTGRRGPTTIVVQVDRREIARAVTMQGLWDR